MRFVANVLSPGIYARQSMYNISDQLPQDLTIKLFDNIEEAQAWLESCG
jgi:hypothetical protein